VCVGPDAVAVADGAGIAVAGDNIVAVGVGDSVNVRDGV